MNFSIIIPYHNSKTKDRTYMIEELLKSVPARDDLEVVLVNDHSEIAFETNKKFPFFLKHIKSKPGLRYAGNARNEGIKNAEGKFIIFADSDDLFTPEFDDILNDVLQKNTDNVYLYCATSFYTETGEQSERHIPMNKYINLYKETGDSTHYSNFLNPVGKIIPKNYITDNNLSFTGHTHGNDIVFCTRLFVQCPKPFVINKIGYNIRDHKDSLMGNHTVKSLKSRIDARRQANKIFRENGYSKQQKTYNRWLFQLSQIDSKAAYQEFLTCARENPSVALVPDKFLLKIIAEIYPFTRKVKRKIFGPRNLNIK